MNRKHVLNRGNQGRAIGHRRNPRGVPAHNRNIPIHRTLIRGGIIGYVFKVKVISLQTITESCNHQVGRKTTGSRSLRDQLSARHHNLVRVERDASKPS